MEFTNSTLNNIIKEAKKRRKNDKLITLSKHKDIISVERGYKSYNDLYKYFYTWLNLSEVIIIFKKNDIGSYYYQINNSSKSSEKKLLIDDINHTQKFGLKLLELEDLDSFLDNYIEKSSKFNISNIKFSKDKYVFFKLTSKRLDIQSLKKDSKQVLEKHFRDNDKYMKITTDETKLKKKLNSIFYNDLPYTINNLLTKNLVINSDYIFETILFNPQYFLVENKILNAIDIYDEY